MNTLTVELGERSYPILIGPGLAGQGELLCRHVPGRQVLLLSNHTVAPLHAEPVIAALRADGRQVALFEIADGEQHKTVASWEAVLGQLLEHGFDRRCCLLTLGGGVVGDIGGFAAASYQRGVDFVQLPTSLLAQVDSSVGGKTGVNHPLGKNMIGAFHQPRAVLADTDWLATLPERELRAGLAEVIKYGLGLDGDFLRWLERSLEALLARDGAALGQAIAQSCRIKARVVAADEREAGQRALLNLGHTFGHAIETHTGYGNWLHGEAIAAGMVMAAQMSALEGRIDRATAERARRLIERAGLPVAPPADMDSGCFLALMRRDKKSRDDCIHLVLMDGPGQSLCTAAYDHNNLVQLIDNA